MNDEELTNLFFSDPDKIFTLVDRAGGNLDELKNLQIGKLFAQKRFPELIKQEHIGAVEFMFWFCYFVEREIGDDIYEIEILLGKNPEEIEGMVDGMDFGGKIAFIKKHYVENPNEDSYTALLKKIKDLRNHMAHGRLNKLEYGGYFLSDPRGQLKLTAHFRNALRKKEPFK